jgi:hypothetical protein
MATCAVCGFSGRVYRPLCDVFLRVEHFRCLKCVAPHEMYKEHFSTIEYFRPKDYVPARVSRIDENGTVDGCWGHHIDHGFVAWLNLPENNQ